MLADSGFLKSDDEAFDDVKSILEAPTFGETIRYSELDDYLDEETEGFRGMLMRRKSVPKKSNFIALGVSLRLDLDELLNRAGYCLSDHLEYDKIVLFYILKRIYDIDQINLELYE